MNRQQNAESKLEQAAKDFADDKIGTDLSFLESCEWSEVYDSFIAGAKSEAAKEYWQSLTTPAGNDWKAKFHEWLSGRLDIPIPEMDLIISYVERYIASKPRTVEETE